jgi:hypothetical protein
VKSTGSKAVTLTDGKVRPIFCHHSGKDRIHDHVESDKSMAESAQDEATASSVDETTIDNPLNGNNSAQDAVSATPKKREAPPERPENVSLRRHVIFSFWVIVLFLGLPIWWWTTAIYRARLPLSQMTDWADGRVSLANVIVCQSLTNSGLSTGLSTSNIYRCGLAARIRGAASPARHTACAR